MDPRASIAESAGASQAEASPDSQVAFDATWQASDASLLQPNNLHISKVQRAWERRPLNPFSRQKLRVGKVWKRPTPAQRDATPDASLDTDRAVKRRKPRTSFGGLMKPVKKMCLDSDFGMAPRVLQWDAIESPARKIVTRSNASEVNLLALPEEDDDVEDDNNTMTEEGDVTVEILDEDGTVLETGGEELANQEEWQDEVDKDSVSDHIIQDAPESMEESSAEPESPVAEVVSAHTLDTEDALQASPVTATQVAPHVTMEVSVELVNGAVLEDETVSDAVYGHRDSPRPFSTQLQAPSSSAVSFIPEGFVSPMKKAVAPQRNGRRRSADMRRRTLPNHFAPTSLLEGESIMPATDIDAPSHDETSEVDQLNAEEAVHSISTATDTSDDGDNEWEDVEDDESDSDALEPASHPDHDIQQEADVTVDEGLDQAVTATFVVQHGDTPQPEHESVTHIAVVRPVEDIAQNESNLPSSPIPSIEGPHPRLPLRRSPRRKSSSPLKQSTILPSTETSHLVAWTPISKFIKAQTTLGFSPLAEFAVHEGERGPQAPGSIERAASAPPEEAQMSPYKPSRPRVSDDTALLQAFLNRAAETRSSRRASTSKRESITNRRDSDTVRQALASPGKTDVLGDLDPNSPSPRKPLINLDPADVFGGIELGSTASPERDTELGNSLVTRRRDRAAKRPQPQTPVAPNKISIRGNAEYTVSKRTEAQELALLTRTNTRKNKGTAVLPPARLTKLSIHIAHPEIETGANETETAGEGKARTSKTVAWAEALVEFYQGGEVSETSLLSDELTSSVPIDQVMKADGEGAASVEPPSKAKLRRLKPPRTAGTPAKPPSATASTTTTAADKPASLEANTTSQSKALPQTKRRSRIATPAKGLTTASLLPSDLDTADTGPTQQPQVPERKLKKVATSKLRAPSAPASSASTSLVQGKENLISSPAKKRSGGPPTVKLFAPKLDLGNKTQLLPDETTAVPGLASPAKKSKGRGVLFGGNAPTLEFDAQQERSKEDIPNLSSPAKKKTRRLGGAY